jgi:hypothetical protein
MLEFISLYPLYLTVLTVVLVFLPTTLALGIRITLYRHFQDSAKKVKRITDKIKNLVDEESKETEILDKIKNLVDEESKETEILDKIKFLVDEKSKKTEILDKIENLVDEEIKKLVDEESKEAEILDEIKNLVNESKLNKIKKVVNEDVQSKKPKILLKLDKRFKWSSQYLETVNTSALIDEIYGEEKFPFLGFSLGCVKWDYLGTILPNLLLAFGLLGTFWGITTNLTNMSSLINQGSANTVDLIDKLQAPLQSMGIAFITSLVALLCSSILTVANFFFNTNIARIGLLSSLEDYLDNIVQPTIEGRSRLDRAVNRMVEQQHEFLLNFHNNVTRILESSLTQVANRITDGNQETAKLVTQVCNQLNETAVTLSSGGDNFNRATRSFEQQVIRLDSLIQHENFVRYSTTLDSCATNFKTAIDTLVRSQVTENLVTTAQNLNSTQERFSTTVQSLQGFSNTIQSAIDTLNTSLQNSLAIEEQIRDISQDFYRIQEQNLQVNTSFSQQTLIHLSDLRNDLAVSNNTLKEKLEQLVISVQSIEIEQPLSELSQSFHTSQEKSDQLQTSFSQQTLAHLSDLRNNVVIGNNKLKENLEQLVISLQNMHNNLLETTHNVSNNTERLQSLGDRITKTIQQESGKETYQSQIIAQRSEQTVGYLKDIQTLLQQMIGSLDRLYRQNQNSKSPSDR